MRQSFLLLAACIVAFPTWGQRPEKPNSADIYHQIEKLNFLGNILYIAAHPDDENTRLISYLSNEVHARTGYLSLTRGDGGQNLIGPELRELLGVIRTQELIEARKIDGGEQYFSRANDFGFSKNPTETLQIWDKNQVLSDVVWAIRTFRPDIIINRFDHRSPGTTHGHHTASAMLSMEAFDLANQPNQFADQLAYTQPWQPQRIYFNTSWWFYGSKEKFEKADKSKQAQLQIGVYYPFAGKSNQEIAALSRSCHQSQGFGNTGTRGEEDEYLEFLKGTAPANKNNLFDGIDTTWNRLTDGKAVGELLAKVQKEFNYSNPGASVPDLIKAYSLIQQLQDPFWRNQKSEEIKKIIAACSGLYLEAVSDVQETTPGSTIKVKLEAINRSANAWTLNRVETYPKTAVNWNNQVLTNNKDLTTSFDLSLPNDYDYTAPYYLKEEGTVGMYTVNDRLLIGKPDVQRATQVTFFLSIQGVEIPFTRKIVYKYNDDVKGEVYQPLDIVPAATSSIKEKVYIFPKNRSHEVRVIVKAGKENLSGSVQLQVPTDWKVSPEQQAVTLQRKGETAEFVFTLTPPKEAAEAVIQSVVTVDNQTFKQDKIDINYTHIYKQMVLKSATAKAIKLNIKTNEEKIAYIMGAGDEVPNSLTQMGYEVTVVKPESLTPELLQPFDVVMSGIRAYNVVNQLAYKQQVLLDFVKSGKTMIVQYNTLDDMVTKEYAPYPLKISRDRVTEENAEVRFLQPNHRILNYPNKITSADFTGWKQEQGLYYPSEWDAQYTALISANDQGEKPKDGAILVAPYGKGTYIYTGLSFFRELPEGVPGAFRLMANLISAKN
ncbi:PIG-L family deacetylase [Flavobacterium stagni]|uniref:PIG-L family deacetylase n=1 Tax=Flavobacterium stagni TaxID=2506421 RepID=A0A4Q1K757_9FLAO|nr:PIG-L family deacetylase [Flavobacterium stagni]RXR21444.1 PIG-L family deacetylase [Flavobacterium stagni]